MEKPAQQMMTEEQFRNIALYTDSQMELIRATFRTKAVVMALRKFLWQMPMSKDERNALKSIKGKVVELLRGTFIPTLGSMETLEEMKDVWLFDFENTTPQYAMQLFKVRQLVGRYFNQMLDELEGNDLTEKINFADLSNFQDKTPEDAYVDMSARNMIARETQRYLCLLYILAQPPTSTEQLKKEAQINSNK